MCVLYLVLAVFVVAAEVVEARTIVLGTGVTQGWRAALIGAIVGLGLNDSGWTALS